MKKRKINKFMNTLVILGCVVLIAIVGSYFAIKIDKKNAAETVE